jgi:iron complex outermembrane recepter protein
MAVAPRSPGRRSATLLAIWAALASADPAGAEGPDPAPVAPPDGAAAPAPPADPLPTPGDGLADALFLDPAITGEAILIFEERPDKPYDRDTELRLTGDELARRGAVTLADALALLPDVTVRAAGRGGQQIEIRGARKGSVKVLVDGASISDPYYGNLDISAIPVTDIEQIRVSTSPASPIDGVGGPGGVIEVHTRDAVGARLLHGRMVGSTLPSAEAAATGRAALGAGWAMRASASGTVGARDFELGSGAERTVLGEDRRREVITLRVERRRGATRLVSDLWLQEGAYVSPPGGDDGNLILVVDGERQGRVGVQVDHTTGKARLQSRAYLHLLERDSAYYSDPELSQRSNREDLSADRAGATALGSYPLGPRGLVVASLSLDSEHARVRDGFGLTTSGRASTLSAAAGAQLDGRRWRLDGALGAAAPFGIDAEPWPEGKLAAGLRPHPALDLEATVARKGRTPTLRERFRTDVGNQALGPEQVSSAELAVAMVPHPAVRLRATPWLKRTSGVVRFDGDRDMLINTGELDLRGVELELHLLAGAPVGGGASYGYTDVHSPASGGEVLDFLPRHRASAWLDARMGDRATARLRARRQSSVIDRQERLPARGEVDVVLWSRLSAGLGAALRIDNLLDRRYAERLGVAAVGRVVLLSIDGRLE